MKVEQKLKSARGITLIMLIITIIVLIILAGVSITAVLSQDGVIEKSREAKEKTLNAEVHEQKKMNEVVNYIQNKKENNSSNNNENELILKDKSYVGYYADVNGDGIVDGVIYADLAIGGSGEWGTYNYEGFSYEAISGTKDYYISQKDYEGKFGIKDVLTAVENGKDRFYVMELEDIDEGNTYCWYDAAWVSVDNGISDYATVTLTSFGSGKKNTETMIEKWNNSVYGVQNDNEEGHLDIWGVIQDKANEGWFLASREEWTAFAYNMGITIDNYGDYGFNFGYWTSSLNSIIGAWMVGFDIANVGGGGICLDYYIRLSTTF